MTKRILSAVLSLALLLSCVSGITLFTVAEDTLPAPYVTLETASGEAVTEFTIGPQNQDDQTNLNGSTEVVAIGNTDMHGIELLSNWGGFYIRGDLKKNIPAGQGAVVVIECYANAAGDFLRLYGVLEGHAAIGTVKANETSLIFVELTADEITGWSDRVQMTFQRTAAQGDFYIRSVRVIDPQYADLPTDPGYEYYDFSGDVALCDYYPGIKTPNTYMMGYTDEESPFRQYKVFGTSFSQSDTANKPVYIKFYTNEANADTTIGINTYQVYGKKQDGTYAATHSSLVGYTPPNVTVKDGVGGVLLPETCFRNSANAGSFRLNTSDAAKVTRVEVYDVTTYCESAAATETMKAELHTAMLAGLVNVEKDGYMAPTVDAPGATGVVTCATCGAVLSASTEIPQLTAYAQIDFNHADGAETTSIKSLGGLSTPVQIPGTDCYGAKLTYQNNTLTFALDTFGITAADIAKGTKLAITYEYYASPAWGGGDRLTLQTAGGYNLAAYGAYANNQSDALAINRNHPMTSGELAIVTYTVGDGVTYVADKAGNIGNGTQAVAGEAYDTVATANALVNGNAMTLILWNNKEASTGDESKAMYIKSVTVHDAAELVEPGEHDDCYYVDFVGVATNPKYYPTYLTTSANGLAVTTGREEEYYPEDTAKEYIRYAYMFVKVPEALLSDAETLPATPVKLVIERKAGSNINHIYYQYQTGGPGPVWSGTCYVDFDEEGVYETYLWDAKFFNSLNNQSSIRLRDTIHERVKEGDAYTFPEALGDELEDIASIKVYDLSVDCKQYHDRFTEENGNLIREGRIDPTYEAVGQTGRLICAHCREVFSESTEIPKLENYVQMDFSTGTAKLQGVKTLFAIDDSTSTVPVAIPGLENVYALAIGAHNSGIRFSLTEFGGYTAEDIENGLELAVSVEYYLPTTLSYVRFAVDGRNGLDKILGIYSAYGNTTWDCAVVNPNTPLVKNELGLATFKVGKNVTYITGPGQFGADNKFTEPVEVGTKELALDLVNGEEVYIRAWMPDNSPAVYIKSITIYDARELAERETVESEIDYMDMQVEFAACPVYYPQYVEKGYSDGLSCIRETEKINADGTDITYGYFAVSRAKIAADEAYHPVMVRFTFKDDTAFTSFTWSYQVARPDKANPGVEWRYLTTDITDSVVEVLLEDAVFENGLNGKGSFRLTNGTQNGQVIDDLLKVEVISVVDRDELEAAIADAEAAGRYKTPDTVAVLNAALEQAATVMENGWATEADIAEAIDALRAAVAQLVDCEHQNGKESVGYVAATCLEPGYTGDQACVDCGFVADGDEGEEIPAHATKLINVKAASCKEPGYTGDLWCEEDETIVTSGTAVMALPHTWNEGEVTKPATKNERGEITKTCEKCGATTVTRFDYVAQAGDVDGSGKIDSTDARLVLQFAVKKIVGNALNMDVADVDGSGTIDSTDARLILQLAVGKIKEFPRA